jgi:hypothetical protein
MNHRGFLIRNQFPITVLREKSMHPLIMTEGAFFCCIRLSSMRLLGMHKGRKGKDADNRK